MWEEGWENRAAEGVGMYNTKYVGKIWKLTLV